MKLSDKTIKEIAGELSTGSICYLHKETHEVISVIDPDEMYDNEELWAEVMEPVNNDPDNYIKIDKMSSRAAFESMEAFAEQLPDSKIKERLFYALNQPKPFRHFKYEVDYEEDIRQQWFKFRDLEYEAHVRGYLANADFESEDQ